MVSISFSYLTKRVFLIEIRTGQLRLEYSKLFQLRAGSIQLTKVTVDERNLGTRIPGWP